MERISGKAVCCGCGGENFEIVIYNDSTHKPVCLNSTCRQIWEALGQASGPIAVLSDAVAD